MPRTDEAVLGRLDLGAEAAQAVDDAGDPVGLLQAQLLRAAHDRLALGEAAEQRDQRQLVDRERDLVGLDDRAHERRRRATSSSPIGSSAGDASRRRPRARRARSRPSARAIRRKPVRVQLTPTSSITTREPRHEQRRRDQNAADDGSPGTSHVAELELVDAARPSTRRPSRRDRGAGAQQHPLGVVAARRAARSRSSRPSASSPASSTHDFTCALATGSSYSMPCRRAPLTVNGGKRPSVASMLRAHRAQRLGDAVDRAGGGSTRRRRACSARPSCAGEPARAAAASACRRCRRRSARRARARSRSPTPRMTQLARRAARRARRAPARRRASSSCPRRRGSCAIAHGLVAHRAEQRGAVRDRLVRRARASVPRSGPAGLEARVVTPAPPGARARRSSSSRAPRRSSPATHSAIDALGCMSGDGVERHVDDVDARAARARARCSATTPGPVRHRRRAARAPGRRPARPRAAARRSSAARVVPGRDRLGVAGRRAPRARAARRSIARVELARRARRGWSR